MEPAVQIIKKNWPDLQIPLNRKKRPSVNPGLDCKFGSCAAFQCLMAGLMQKNNFAAISKLQPKKKQCLVEVQRIPDRGKGFQVFVYDLHISSHFASSVTLSVFCNVLVEA